MMAVTAGMAEDGNLVIVMSKLGLLLPAVIVLALALWTTTDNNIYSSSLAFTNAAHLAGVNIPKWVFCIVSDAIAMGVAFLGLASKFSSWLSFTGSLWSSMASISLEVGKSQTSPFTGFSTEHLWMGSPMSSPSPRSRSAPRS